MIQVKILQLQLSLKLCYGQARSFSKITNLCDLGVCELQTSNMQTKMNHKALQFRWIRSSCIGYLNPLSASVRSYRNQSIDLLCKWHFHTIFTLLCGALKSLMKAFKAFIKPFEAPQRNVKIKISLNFFSSSRIGTWKVKVILFLFFSFWIQFVFNYKIFFENLKLRVKCLTFMVQCSKKLQFHPLLVKKVTLDLWVMRQKWLVEFEVPTSLT